MSGADRDAFLREQITDPVAATLEPVNDWSTLNELLTTRILPRAMAHREVRERPRSPGRRRRRKAPAQERKLLRHRTFFEQAAVHAR
jgi:hypothetical protein